MLAMPHYFTDQDKQWALKHILATTYHPDRLLKRPRWSLFGNGKYCAIGVTCNVKDLSINSHYQADFQGRSVYVFLGYVARLERGKFPTLPQYGNLELAEFALAYQRYIPQCWTVKSYETASKQPISTRESEVNRIFSDLKISRQVNRFSCNLDPNYKGLYPEEYQSQVWNNVVLEITNHPDRTCSLALGLSPGKEINNSPFFNLTLPNLDLATTIETIRETSTTPVSRDELIPLELSRDREERYPTDSHRALGEYVGVIVVGTLVGVFFPTIPIGTLAPLWRVAPLLLLGSTLGSLAVGCITNRGVGGVLRRKTGELWTNSIGDRDRKCDSSPQRQRDKNLGFKELDRQNDRVDRRDWY
jgi:hypothetical protein